MRGTAATTALLAFTAVAAVSCAGRAGTRFEPYAEAEVATVRNVHNYRGKPLCQACHVQNGDLKVDPVALCSSCHRFDMHNHPVNVVQKTRAEGVPLWEGKVACHSCHDPHDVTKNRKGLRVASADELCLRCHVRH